MSNRPHVKFDINRSIKDALESGCLADDYFIPRRIKATWNVYLSERNRAKTTTWLIVGVAAYQRYGTITHVLRSREQMIAESKICGMYDVLLKNDYISKLTCGKWNSIVYQRNKRAWYLCNRDKTNCNITETDNKPCTKMMSVDKSDEYKSGYVCTDADLVIYDEFQNLTRRKDDNILLLNILYTLFRDREGCKIIMLSNTLDKDDIYFDDLYLRDFISLSTQGDNTRVVTPRGTSIYCELLDKRKISQIQDDIVSEYYGLGTKGIEAITGEGWQILDAKHIQPYTEYERLSNNIYCYTRASYMHINIVRIKDTHKLALYITPATHARDNNDEIIYTRDISNAYKDKIIKRDLSMCNDPLSKIIRKLIARDDVYYSDNTCAVRFKRYIDNKE